MVSELTMPTRILKDTSKEDSMKYLKRYAISLMMYFKTLRKKSKQQSNLFNP